MGGKDSCLLLLLLLLPPCIFFKKRVNIFLRLLKERDLKGRGSESPIDVTAETVGEVILPPLLNATACSLSLSLSLSLTWTVTTLNKKTVVSESLPESSDSAH